MFGLFSGVITSPPPPRGDRQEKPSAGSMVFPLTSAGVAPGPIPKPCVGFDVISVERRGVAAA